jgi:hypothetical protein
MEYQRVPVQIDLNDPEEGFRFSSTTDGLVLSFVDWEARRVQIRFSSVFRFCYVIGGGFRGLPEGRFIELVPSADVEELISNHVAMVGDGLRHFVISTNEDEWCEVIASGYDLTRDA